MSYENDIPEGSSQAHQIYLAARRTDARQASQICAKHGSKDGSFPGIPAARKPAALIALQALIDDGGDGHASARKPLPTWDEVTRDAYSRWNRKSATG